MMERRLPTIGVLVFLTLIAVEACSSTDDAPNAQATAEGKEACVLLGDILAGSNGSAGQEFLHSAKRSEHPGLITIAREIESLEGQRSEVPASYVQRERDLMRTEPKYQPGSGYSDVGAEGREHIAESRARNAWMRQLSREIAAQIESATEICSGG